MFDYKIEGSSNISTLESDNMFLTTFEDSRMSEIDSATVLHGKFTFDNTTEKPRMAFLQMEGIRDVLLPIVIEEGDIKVSINKTGTKREGTLLNERLNHFVKVQDSLKYQLIEMEREYDRAFMDSEDMGEVYERLRQKSKEINEQLDLLITTSIKENFDNVLGPGIFMMQTIGLHPENYPWVTAIMLDAPESFKNDEYVRFYFQEVKRELNSGDFTPRNPNANAAAAQSNTDPTAVAAATPADSSVIQQTEALSNATSLDEDIMPTQSNEQ